MPYGNAESADGALAYIIIWGEPLEGCQLVASHVGSAGSNPGGTPSSGHSIFFPLRIDLLLMIFS